MRGHEDFQQKAMLLYGPTHLAGFGTAAFGKLAVLKIAFWNFSLLGISGSLVSKFKLSVSKLSGILLFVYVFGSMMTLWDVLHVFIRLMMFDDV